jgi:hypothetical protein
MERLGFSLYKKIAIPIFTGIPVKTKGVYFGDFYTCRLLLSFP